MVTLPTQSKAAGGDEGLFSTILPLRRHSSGNLILGSTNPIPTSVNSLVDESENIYAKAKSKSTPNTNFLKSEPIHYTVPSTRKKVLQKEGSKSSDKEITPPRNKAELHKISKISSAKTVEVVGQNAVHTESSPTTPSYDHSTSQTIPDSESNYQESATPHLQADLPATSDR